MFSQIFRRRMKFPLRSRSFRPGMETLEGRFPPGNLLSGLTPLGWWGADTVSQTIDPVTLPSIARTDFIGEQFPQNSNRGMPDNPGTVNLVSLLSQEDQTPGTAGKTAEAGHTVSADSLVQDPLTTDQLLASTAGINPGIVNGDAGLGAGPKDLTSDVAGGVAHDAMMSVDGVATGYVFGELNQVSGLNRGLFRSPHSIPQPSADRVAPTQKPNTSGVRQSFEQVPLSFEANLGQTDSQVQFLARGQGFGLFLTSTEAVMTLQKPAAAPSANGSGIGIGDASQAVLRMQVVGGNPSSQATGQDPLAEKVNYYIGNDPTKWHTGISTYGRVEFQSVYAGINLAYYGTQQQMEYDFIVTPGASPNAITLGFAGADHVAIDPQGDLVLTTAGTQFQQHKPFVYQESAGIRQEITSRFVWKDAQHIGFQVGAYNPNLPLVIDPSIEFSDYLGGNGTDETRGISVDPTNGFALMTGLTTSTNFPTVNPIQGSLQGGSDAFVAFLDTFNVLGGSNQMVYVTYLGGSNSEDGNAIAVDPYYGSGIAFVTGFTNSTNFPTTAGAFQTTYGGGSSSAFVTELNENGTIAHSTYLGGRGADEGLSIAMDPNFDAIVTGYTSSNNFPTSAGAFQTTYGGGVDAFMTRFDQTLSFFDVSTFIGGSNDDIGFGVAVDNNYEIYLTGYTASPNFPTTPGAFQRNLAGLTNAFVMHFDISGNIVYSTLLGGEGTDIGMGLAVDTFMGTGTLWVTGSTSSRQFPTLNASQSTYGGGASDAYVAAFDYFGNPYFSTFLGGPGEDEGLAIAIDNNYNSYVTGSSTGNFPLLNPFQTNYGGGQDDAFITKLDTFDNRIYSSYLGGSGDDQGLGVATDFNGFVYVVGLTSSTNFPRVSPLHGGFGGGVSDGFITIIA